MNAPAYRTLPDVTDSDGQPIKIFSGVREELNGPDLDALAPWDEFVAMLDASRNAGDLEKYVTVWLWVSDVNGTAPFLMWRPGDDAEDRGSVYTGVACDRLEKERRRRRDDLDEHSKTVDGFDMEVRRELHRRYRYTDNRKSPHREIFAVVRAFMATGGRLLIAPEGTRRRREPVESGGDLKLLAAEDWAGPATAAAKAMERLIQRWHVQPIIERIVRRIGKRTDNGWIVLEDEFEAAPWIERFEAVGAYCQIASRGLSVGWKVAGNPVENQFEARRLFGVIEHSPGRWAAVEAAAIARLNDVVKAECGE